MKDLKKLTRLNYTYSLTKDNVLVKSYEVFVNVDQVTTVHYIKSYLDKTHLTIEKDLDSLIRRCVRKGLSGELYKLHIDVSRPFEDVVKDVYRDLFREACKVDMKVVTMSSGETIIIHRSGSEDIYSPEFWNEYRPKIKELAYHNYKLENYNPTRASEIFF